MYSSHQDGGWGWIVVAGAFVAQMLSDGISYGFGILYVDLMETFHGTSAEISSIGSLSYGSFCLIGPVAGILTNKFGYRFVTILGALLEALGVFLSAFTPNLEFLYFSVGILIGVGGGMMYIASFVCVSEYFVAKRPVATSIASCGSSAGTFLFGFLYRVCIDHFGWRGALLVFSGLMLNGVVCGAFFRPFVNKTTECNNVCKHSSESPRGNRADLLSHPTDTSHLDIELNAISNDNQYAHDKAKSSEDLQSEHNDIVSGGNVEKKMIAAEEEHLLENYYKLKLRTDAHTCIADAVEDSKESLDILHTDPAMNAELQIANGSSNDSTSSPVNEHASRDVIERQHSKIVSLFKTVTGTTGLFRNGKFIMFGVSIFLYCFGYGIPFVLLPDMAEMNGFTPSEAAWVISELGIAAIVGKFLYGALSQVFTNKVSRANTKLNSYSVILAGLAIACSPWAQSYPVLLIIGAAFGISSAAVNTLFTLVLIELLGEDSLANAFGWLNFFGGAGYILGPFIAGWLYDITSTYIAAFIAAGSSLILAGVVLFPIFMCTSGTFD